MIPAALLLAICAQIPAQAPPPLRDLGKTDEVRLVYFLPSDRKPTRDFEKKIAVLMSFVADVYRDSLSNLGVPASELGFEFEGKKPRVNVVEGREPAAFYNGRPGYKGDQWGKIVPEVERLLGPASRSLYVIFAETYDEGPWEFEFPGGVALGARYSPRGGVGLFSAWILRDEFCATSIEEQMRFLFDKTPIAGRKALGASAGNSPRFEFIEDGFGAVVHELGHALGLPHDQRRDSIDVMGNGFRRLQGNYARAAGARPEIGFSLENARILACTRFLGLEPDQQDTKAPEVELAASFEGPSRRSVVLTGQVRDDSRLGALLVVDQSTGSVLGGLDLGGMSQELAATLVLERPLGEDVALEILVTDRGGNVTSHRSSVRPAAGEARGSALIFLVEGLGPEVFDLREARALRSLQSDGLWTNRAWLPWPSTRPAGWASLLTGVGPAKHNVLEAWNGVRAEQHPAFLDWVERFDSAVFTACIVDWPTVNGALLERAKIDARVSLTEGGVSDWMARLEELSSKPAPLCLVVGSSELAGSEGKEGKPSKQALLAFDQALGRAIQSIRERPDFERENWLFAVATPFRNALGAHAKTAQPISAPLWIAGAHAGRGELRGTVNQLDLVPTVLDHLGIPPDPAADLDGLPIQVRAATPLGENLLRNGGAEAGPGFERVEVEGFAVPGWCANPGFVPRRYEGCDFFPEGTPLPPERGQAFFQAAALERTTMEQEIDVADLADGLDKKRIRYRLEAWIGGYEEQRDAGRVVLTFLDERSKELGTVALGPLTPEMRREVIQSEGRAGSAFLLFQSEGPVPRKTRRLRVSIEALRAEGTHNDTYVDDISLSLQSRP